jgi:DNA-binding CsgD family transcriptional regulator
LGVDEALRYIRVAEPLAVVGMEMPLSERVGERLIAPGVGGEGGKMLSPPPYPTGAINRSPTSPPFPITDELIEPLNKRELEVLQLVAAGYANRAIADALIVAESTIKWHLKHIYGKLAVHSRMQAVIRARQLNLLSS